MQRPTDLIPLPTMPWEERPSSLPLDIEECRTALWINNGNITDAATMMKVSAARFRRFVQSSPYLSAEATEAREQLKDIAEKNVLDALTDAEDPGRRDAMSRFVLTNIGRDRGYGTGNTGKTQVNIGNISITWGDGTDIGSEIKTVEGELVSENE